MADAESPADDSVPLLGRREKRLEDTALRRFSVWNTVVCCGARSSTAIGTRDRDALWELRAGCNTAFDVDASTEKLFCDIWNAAFPDRVLTEVDKSDDWKRLGFQGKDPRTDVRTGRFVLDQLHYLAVEYPEKTRQFVKQAEELDYYFAITCFNLTHMLVVFFDLVNAATVSPVQGAVEADLDQLKHFAHLCSSSQGGALEVLNELFVVVVEKMHLTWKDMKVSQDCNVMQHFGKAMTSVYKAHAEFWDKPRHQTADLRLML